MVGARARKVAVASTGVGVQEEGGVEEEREGGVSPCKGQKVLEFMWITLGTTLF